jgi:hypothetical protein
MMREKVQIESLLDLYKEQVIVFFLVAAVMFFSIIFNVLFSGNAIITVICLFSLIWCIHNGIIALANLRQCEKNREKAES